MTTRTVTGTIREADGTPWVGAVVIFVLIPGSYTNADTYPQQRVSATTDANGAFTATLWINTEGLTNCAYTCILPSRESFTFDLPAGAGPADLSALRTAGSTPINTTTAQSLIDQRGLPPGGTTGQVLAKDSGTDYDVSWQAGGGGGAPTDASYVVLGAAAGLSAERILSAGDNVTLTDGGPGGALTVAVPSVPWGDVAGTPTTLAGYGISDAASDAELAAEAAARVAGDAALDTRVDALEIAPPAHAASHGSAGSDPVTLAQSQVTNLTADLAAKATTAALAAHTGAGPSGVHGITDAGAALAGAADAAAQRVALGLGTAAQANTGTGAANVPTITQADARYQPLDSELTALAALTTTAYGRALLELADAATARGNLGLGALATLGAVTASLISDASANGRSLITAADYAAMRSLLSLVVGTNVQAQNANLAALAGLTLAADRLPYATGAGALDLTTLSAFARTILDDADAATVRGTIGAEPISPVVTTVATLPISPSVGQAVWCGDCLTPRGVGALARWDGVNWRTTDGSVATTDAETYLWDLAVIGQQRRGRWEWASFDDAIGGSSPAEGSFAGNASGAGTIADLSGLLSSARIGIQEIGTGSTSTGRGAWRQNHRTGALGTEHWVLAIAQRIATLSDAVEEYHVRWGLDPSIDSVYPAYGVFFMYDRAGVNGTASNNWLAVCRASSTQTVVDTGVPVDTGWHSFSIYVPSDRGYARFRLDGTQVAQITTNIPFNTNGIGPRGIVLKSAGTNARVVYHDWRFFALRRTVALDGL